MHAPSFKFISIYQQSSSAAIARGDEILIKKPDYFQPGIGLGPAVIFWDTSKSKNGLNDWVQNVIDGDRKYEKDR